MTPTEQINKLNDIYNLNFKPVKTKHEIELAISIYEDELEFLNNLILVCNDCCSDDINSNNEIEDRIKELQNAIKKGKEVLK